MKSSSTTIYIYITDRHWQKLYGKNNQMSKQMYENVENNRIQSKMNKFIVCEYERSHIIPVDEYSEHLNNVHPSQYAKKKNNVEQSHANYIKDHNSA